MHLRHAATLATLLLSGSLLGGCAGQVGGASGDATSDALSQVPGTVRVNGTSYSVENEYLPRVVMCEDPGAPKEALRAQAIAARTYLTYRTLGQASPTITDGQSDQVFTCSSNKNGTYVSDDVKAAVAATAGQIVLHGTTVTAGFFVAGAKRASTTSCAKGADATNTERFVTINAGKSGSDVVPSVIGSKSSPANRGALGQNLANCLAVRDSLTAPQLLAYFYGADITVRGNATTTKIPGTAMDATDPTDGGDTTDPTPTGPTCWSYTTQSDLPLGACVTSSVDGIEYQCTSTGDWATGVSDGAGPAGDCTSTNQ